MITEAEIISIDYKSNTCVVNIPLFKTINTIWPVRVPATFLSLPGIYSGYKAGDLVWVAFEKNLADKPVVIGKIYRGTTIEAESDGGTVISDNFKATKTAEIPLVTKFINYDKEGNKVYDEAYGTIDALVKRIKELETRDHEHYQISFLANTGNHLTNDEDTTIFLETRKKYGACSGLISQIGAAGFDSPLNYKAIKSIDDKFIGLFVANLTLPKEYTRLNNFIIDNTHSEFDTKIKITANKTIINFRAKKLTSYNIGQNYALMTFGNQELYFKNNKLFIDIHSTTTEIDAIPAIDTFLDFTITITNDTIVLAIDGTVYQTKAITIAQTDTIKWTDSCSRLITFLTVSQDWKTIANYIPCTYSTGHDPFIIAKAGIYDSISNKFEELSGFESKQKEDFVEDSSTIPAYFVTAEGNCVLCETKDDTLSCINISNL